MRERCSRSSGAGSAVAATGRRQDGGLGLGLTLVARWCACTAAGSAAASEGPGRGSVFTVWLPLAAPRCGGRRVGVLSRTVQEASPGCRPTASPGCGCWWWTTTGTPPTPCRRCSTLRATRRGGLRRRGGPGGRARACAPDVVLLDLGMPGIDGCETARRMRAEPWGETLLLVALTGWGQEQRPASAPGRPASTTTWSSRWTSRAWRRCSRSSAPDGYGSSPTSSRRISSFARLTTPSSYENW